MKFYRKQPIEAEQFDGSTEMIERYDMGFQLAPNGKGGAIIKTLEGDLLVHVGDWIVNEPDEIKVMADEEFKQQYAELPVIPKAVADWIEKCKHDGTSVGDMLCSERRPEKMRDWMALKPGTYEFNQQRYTECQNLVARAWLDGYTVEEGK